MAIVLSPTDAALGQAVVSDRRVPIRIRQALNVESGLNDGLALPVVIVLIDVASDAPLHPGTLAAEALGGIALGAAIGVAGALLIKAPWTRASEAYEPLGTVAIAVTVFAAAQLTSANAFLAAFAAGVAVGSLRDPEEHGTADLDETLTELLKLAALLLFGALLSLSFIGGFSVGDYLFVVAALLIPRPAALMIALVGSGMTRQERLAAAWFGPKGFASVVYALLVLHAGLGTSDEIFHLAGAVVALSIVAHSSTDHVIALWFERSGKPSGTADMPPVEEGSAITAVDPDTG